MSGIPEDATLEEPCHVIHVIHVIHMIHVIHGFT